MFFLRRFHIQYSYEKARIEACVARISGDIIYGIIHRPDFDDTYDVFTRKYNKEKRLKYIRSLCNRNAIAKFIYTIETPPIKMWTTGNRLGISKKEDDNWRTPTTTTFIPLKN